MNMLIDLSRLEPLIGIEAWFEKERPYALLLRPYGFVVVEDAETQHCNENLHLLTKYNIDSLHALEELGAKHCRIAGLKDAEGVTSQYASCKGEYNRFKKGQNYSAAIVSSGMRGCLRRGRIRVNWFNIVLMTSQPARPKTLTPNYYGYQRFGTRRPNSHLLGFFLVRGDYAASIEEMLFRKYPFESGRLGDYEERAKRLLETRRRVPRIGEVLRRHTLSIIVAALQSYLFNRILSRLVKEYGEKLCTLYPRIPLPGCGYKTGLERLNARQLLDAYLDVLEEEGVSEELLCKARLGSPPRETCIKPVETHAFTLRESEGEAEYVVHIFGLKSGEYATTYLAAHYKLLEPYPNLLPAQLA